MTNHLSIQITPRRAGLASAQANSLDVLVRVQAPERPATLAARPRLPLHIAIVIDRSGSMEGQPIDEARKAASFAVRQLLPEDRCSIVAYDDRVDVLAQAQPVGDRQRLLDIIRTISTRGSTNLHGGWLAGAETLAPFTSPTSISRVILISDGNANAGETDGARITAQVSRLKEAGVTTSTLGVGFHFNESLMTAIAVAGGGRAYYGETAEELMGPFREELELLDAIAGRRVACLIKPVAGVEFEVLNNYPRDAAGRVVLPDVAWGSEAVIAVRLTVPASLVAGTNVVELLSATVGYTDLDGVQQGVASAPLVLPVLDAAAHAALAEDETVVRRFGEVEVARLQMLARRAALDGDWRVVNALLAEIRAKASDNPWVMGMVDEIERLARMRDSARFSKEAYYSAHSMDSRLSSRDEGRDMSAEARKARHLERKMNQGRHRKPE